MSALCMEPASQTQAGMAGEEASRDPPPPAAVPPPPPPAAPSPPPPAPPPTSSSASSKRRWSPSTWRYAIEDSQAELPSRLRPTAPSTGIATAPSSSRPLHSSPPQQPFKSKPPYYNPLYGKAAEQPHRGAYTSRTQTVVEAHVRSSPSQLPAGAKARASEVNRKSNHHPHNYGARACENGEDEEDEDDEEQEDHGDDQGPALYDDEYFKKRRREMSPSELYFCEICSEKAVNEGSLCAYPHS